MKLNVLFLSLFICSFTGFGQDSSNVEELGLPILPMVTNRPGATEASRAVYHKGFQMEIGFEYGNVPERKGSDKHSQYIYLPQFNLQYGVSKNVELRVASTNYAVREKINNDYTQFSYNLDNIVVGAKINLIDAEKWKPELALLITQSFPSNTSNYRKYWPTTFLLAWGYSLPKNFSLSGNLAYINEKVSYDKTIDVTHGWSYTVNAGYSIKDNLGVFAEVFGSDTFNDGADASLTLDAGLWYRFNPKFQVDASAGYGFEVGSTYLNVGFSYLILK
ncbi:MAG: transporter [Salibacteraceae bacterium]